MRWALALLGLALVGLTWWLNETETTEERAGPTPTHAEPRRDGSQPLLAGTPHPRAVPGPDATGARGRAAGPQRRMVRVEGRVLDTEGRPLAGASVRAPDAPEPVPATTTDADGRFALDLPAPGTFALVIGMAGLPEVRVPAAALTGNLSITLWRHLSISGVVEDAETHAPLVGVRVSVAPVTAPDAPTELEATSGADGRFVVAAPSRAAYVLHAGASWTLSGSAPSEYVPTTVEPVAAGTAGVRVAMTRGLAIEGRIVDERGEALATAVTVSAVGRTPSGDPDFTRRCYVRLSDGTLRLPGLAPGQYDLSIRPEVGVDAAERSSAAATVVRDVAAGATGLLVRLRAARRLAGRLVDETGEPVRTGGAVVAFLEGHQRRGTSLTGRVAGDGTFSFAALEEGQAYDLVAVGFPGRREATALRIRPGDADVVLVLLRAGRIVGRVVTDDGRPAPAAVPVGAIGRGAEPGAAGARAFAWTDAEGKFALEGLGTFAFDVEAGGGTSGYLGVLASDVRPDGDEVVLKVLPGMELSGTLVDAHGDPIATTSLQADDGARTAAMRPYAQVGLDGRFRLRGLRAGRVRLTAMQGAEYASLGEVEAPATDVRVTVPAR